MTFDDEQELLILGKIYDIKSENAKSANDFQEIFKETFGQGWDIIYERFKTHKIIIDEIRGERINSYSVMYTTDIGRSKYNKLKEDKRQEDLPFWKKADWWKEEIVKWGLPIALGSFLALLTFLIGIRSCN